MTEFHTPVMTGQVISLLNVAPGQRFLDATVGGAGHALAIIKAGGQVLGLDHDPEAVKVAQQRLPAAQAKVVLGNFANLTQIVKDAGFGPVNGILFDLGVSNYQLDAPQRGFSFQHDAPLDMRMDPNLAVTAADLVNALGRKELYQLFTKLAQENKAGPIANALVTARRQQPITTTGQLAALVERVYRLPARWRGRRRDKLHPATKVFLGLRIAVNDELNNLKAALPQALALLKPQGRLVVLSFHEGEDRIVKHFFRDLADQGKMQILTKKPLTPSIEEVNRNPKSRSAKLRAAVKL